MTTIEKLEELVYHGFRESDRRLQEFIQENHTRSQELDRMFQESVQENERRSHELDRMFQEGVQESKRRSHELDRMFQESVQENERRSQETDLRFQETDRLFRETKKENTRQLKELKKQVAGISDSLGRFAEQMVKPAIIRLFAERGIGLTGVSYRAYQRRNGGSMEIDLLADGPEVVVATEVKLRLEQRYVDEFLEELPTFFEFFPRYRGQTLYGAVAGMSIDDQVVRFAYKHGLFVLAPSGHNMQILNDEQFVPRVFGDAREK